MVDGDAYEAGYHFGPAFVGTASLLEGGVGTYRGGSAFATKRKLMSKLNESRAARANSGFWAWSEGVEGDLGARAARVSTEVVQRAMSRAELAATRETGLLRGGREGTHYVSDAVNSSATRAQSRLALPVRPEVRVTLEVPAGRFSAPNRVQPFEVGPGKVLPGGGMERTATDPLPVRVLGVDDL